MNITNLVVFLVTFGTLYLSIYLIIMWLSGSDKDSKKKKIVQNATINKYKQSVNMNKSDKELLEKKAILKQALLSLKPKYQAVITLHYFENMKLIEIASCMGKHPSTVRTWLNRATNMLRKKLDAACCQ